MILILTLSELNVSIPSLGLSNSVLTGVTASPEFTLREAPRPVLTIKTQVFGISAPYFPYSFYLSMPLVTVPSSSSRTCGWLLLSLSGSISLLFCSVLLASPPF